MLLLMQLYNEGEKNRTVSRLSYIGYHILYKATHKAKIFKML